MLSSLTKRVERQHKVTGIEVVNAGSQITYHAAVLERRKDELSVTSEKANCYDINELMEIIDPNAPVVLTIDGKGVLHKLISGATTNRTQQLNQVLPNASLTDFYLQITPTNQGPIASVIRLDQLNQILQSFEEKSLDIVEVWLGPFNVRHLSNIAGLTKFPTSFGDLEFTSGQIDRWTSSTGIIAPSFSLGDQSMSGEMASSVASSLMPLLNQSFTTSIQPDVAANNKEEYLHKQIFKKLGMGILAGFLGLLLANFLFFQHYFTQNSELGAQLLVQRTQLTELDTLKAQFGRQQQLFSEYNLSRQSRVSYYGDRLAATIPKTIQLERLEIHPRVKDKPGQRSKGYLFNGDRITVSGTAKDCLSVNEWSGKLKQLEWVKEARIVRCGLGDDGKLGFVLEVGK